MTWLKYHGISLLASFPLLIGELQVPGQDATASAGNFQVEFQKPIAIGHRGMFHHYPENTLPAMQACVEAGMGIEFDVRTSRDGELVILHDESLARTTNGGERKVHELTLKELKTLDAGSWFEGKFAGEKIPTLNELLKMVKEKQKGKVLLAVNVKGVDEAGEKKMVDLIRSYGLLEQAFFFDQSPESSVRLKALDPAVRIGKNVWIKKLDEELEAGVVDVFLIGFVPSPEQVTKLRKAGKGIVVNIGGKRKDDDRPEAWKGHLISGIDGILVDYVTAFHEYIATLAKP